MSTQDQNQNNEPGVPEPQPTGPVPDAGYEVQPESAPPDRPTTQLPPTYGEAPPAGQQTYQQAGSAQQGYYQPGAYPPAGYAYPAAAPRTDDKAIWALVSSIAGFFLCPIVLHVVGWVLANQSLRAIRESRGALGGDGVAKAARVLGIVGVVLYGVLTLLAILAFAILIPLGVFAAGTASQQIELGSERVVLTSVSEVDGDRSHDAGDITYDLTAVDFSSADASMAVEVGAGTLVVEVPDDVTVTVDAQVGAGQIELFGDRTDGINLSRDDTFDGEPGAGTLDLDLTVAVGELEVSRG